MTNAGHLISNKRHGGWKSSTVTEGYIEDSINNKIDASNKIGNNESSTSAGDSTRKRDQVVENIRKENIEENFTFAGDSTPRRDQVMKNIICRRK